MIAQNCKVLTRRNTSKKRQEKSVAKEPIFMVSAQVKIMSRAQIAIAILQLIAQKQRIIGTSKYVGCISTPFMAGHMSLLRVSYGDQRDGRI